MIFIDANHAHEIVQRDAANYWPRVAVGGLLVLHDTIKHEGSRKLALELFEKAHPLCTLATSRGSGIAIIRKIT